MAASAEELYGLPLAEFVAERDALARSLKKAGEAVEAERVKGMRKPSVAAWVVNQAVRRSPGGNQPAIRLIRLPAGKAPPAGFEPATLSLEGRRSVQLSYRGVHQVLRLISS